MNSKDIKEKIDELEKKKKGVRLGGGAESIRKQHSRGKTTARERVEKVLDKGSFRELDLLVKHRCTFFDMENLELPADGVVTGYGKIEGRNIFIFSQDFTVMGGTLGEAHAAKIVKVMELAAKVGAPLIGINDSGGARIQEGVDAQYGYARIFCCNTIYSGVIPQISAILGPCAGGAVYSPAITDFVFMTQGISQMFLTGPDVIREVTGRTVTADEIGGAAIHCKTSGVAHFHTKSEDECFELMRKLLGYLPSSSRDKPPIKYDGDPVDRKNNGLLSIVPVDSRKPYDVIEVIKEIADDHVFLEVHKDWARNIVVGFARLKGIPIGVIANQPMFLAGAIDINASDKAARFIRFCDAFNISLLTLVDTPAFLPDKNQELQGIIRHGAKIIFAYAEATVPKVTIILRKGYGGGYIAMCHRELRADHVFAWPTAEIAIMGPEGAAAIIFRREIQAADHPNQKRDEKIQEYMRQFNNPYVSAGRGYIDDVINPIDTRKTIISSLEILLDKIETLPAKKHGNLPV
jgi:acetyl-CoA carboxylase carboxyltransferase component